MDFQAVCNWIVLLGAVAIALTNIIKFFAKPTSFFKKKSEQEIQDRINEAFKNTLPEFFEKHDLETRDRYLADRQKYLEEISNEVFNNTKETLEEIKQINLNQTHDIQNMNNGLKDVMRQKIMTIYHEYKKTRKFPLFAKEALDELYKDYKAQGGNSYIDKYYSRMCSWEIYEEDFED